jgi:hypothetical protein
MSLLVFVAAFRRCTRSRGSYLRYSYFGMGAFLEKPMTEKVTHVYEERKEDFIVAASAMQGWRIDMEVGTPLN